VEPAQEKTLEYAKTYLDYAFSGPRVDVVDAATTLLYLRTRTGMACTRSTRSPFPSWH
jgi:hypothetical protein